MHRSQKGAIQFLFATKNSFLLPTINIQCVFYIIIVCNCFIGIVIYMYQYFVHYVCLIFFCLPTKHNHIVE